MRKRRKTSTASVTLVMGLTICLVVALLQDNLPSLLSKIKEVDYILVEDNNTSPIVIADGTYLKKALQSLQNAKEFVVGNSDFSFSQKIQVYFYNNKCRFCITLSKSDLYGYLVEINNHFYKCEMFTSMILDSCAIENTSNAPKTVQASRTY
ncbi:MAG: hypothetical protein DI598_02095 [Pseudopedobacter saltans]|uniref:Uncharacterized protein n=1 Tax=Pseudopedobacter saltans TaxID=151895 RepID=A0A2W5H918_9SPHI|nr:MAG: hypothetical protein DI598_02095 [Pseudopedobacter saltans]